MTSRAQPEQACHADRPTSIRALTSSSSVTQGRKLKASKFITTKLWVQDASYEGAKPAFEKSLRKQSVFFSHTDPAMVRQLGTRKLDL
jgi:hypothetical protein